MANNGFIPLWGGIVVVVVVSIFLGFLAGRNTIEEAPVALTYTVIRHCTQTEDLMTCLTENGLKVIFYD
jgi:hypothetical protein